MLRKSELKLETGILLGEKEILNLDKAIQISIRVFQVLTPLGNGVSKDARDGGLAFLDHWNNLIRVRLD